MSLLAHRAELGTQSSYRGIRGWKWGKRRKRLAHGRYRQSLGSRGRRHLHKAVARICVRSLPFCGCLYLRHAVAACLTRDVAVSGGRVACLHLTVICILSIQYNIMAGR